MSENTQVEELKSQLEQAALVNQIQVKYAQSISEVAEKYAQDSHMMRRVIFTLVHYQGGRLAIPVEDIVERKFEVTQDDKYLYLSVVEEDSQ
jgi:predicted transcriptional regulator